MVQLYFLNKKYEGGRIRTDEDNAHPFRFSVNAFVYLEPKRVLSHRVLSLASMARRATNPAPLTARKPPQHSLREAYRLLQAVGQLEGNYLQVMLPAGFSA